MKSPLLSRGNLREIQPEICLGSQPHHARKSDLRGSGSASCAETTAAGARTIFPTISSADWRGVFANPRPNALAALISKTIFTARSETVYSAQDRFDRE